MTQSRVPPPSPAPGSSSPGNAYTGLKSPLTHRAINNTATHFRICNSKKQLHKHYSFHNNTHRQLHKPRPPIPTQFRLYARLRPRTSGGPVDLGISGPLQRKQVRGKTAHKIGVFPSNSSPWRLSQAFFGHVSPHPFFVFGICSRGRGRSEHDGARVVGRGFWS